MVEAWLVTRADDKLVEEVIREVMEAMPDPLAEAGDIPERTLLAHQRFQQRIREIDRPAQKGMVRKISARYILKYVAGVAAIVLLSMAGVGLYRHNRLSVARNSPAIHTDMVFHAAKAAITKITLADSSIVRLFPGTTLTVSAGYNIRQRQVSIDGRGYFDVKHDAGRPFYVKAGLIITTVVGTAFEVNTSDSVASTVTVRKGKVNVSVGSALLTSLTQDREITINRISGAYAMHSVDAAALCGWVGGDIDFRQVPMREILKTLSPWYGVSFTVLRPALWGKKLTFFVRKGDLKESMDILSAAGGFRYRIDQDKVFIQ